MTTDFSILHNTCMQQQKGEPSSELMPSTVSLSLCLLVWHADLLPASNSELYICLGSLKVLCYLN